MPSSSSVSSLGRRALAIQQPLIAPRIDAEDRRGDPERGAEGDGTIEAIAALRRVPSSVDLTMTKLRLVSFDICPYVQRSTIALEEKGVPYDIEFVDLADKPAWFLEMSPRGKVPVLQVDDTVLFESTVILEYLDETRAPRLHPEDPLARAKDRAWFSIADTFTTHLYRMMIAEDREALELEAGKVKEQFALLHDEIVGPLWHGERFSAMDAVSYPGLQRLAWLDELYPDLGLFDALPAVRRWVDTMGERPALQRSAVPDLQARFLSAIRNYGPVHAHK